MRVGEEPFESIGRGDIAEGRGERIDGRIRRSRYTHPSGCTVPGGTAGKAIVEAPTEASTSVSARTGKGTLRAATPAGLTWTTIVSSAQWRSPQAAAASASADLPVPDRAHNAVTYPPCEIPLGVQRLVLTRQQHHGHDAPNICL